MQGRDSSYKMPTKPKGNKGKKIKKHHGRGLGNVGSKARKHAEAKKNMGGRFGKVTGAAKKKGREKFLEGDSPEDEWRRRN